MATETLRFDAAQNLKDPDDDAAFDLTDRINVALQAHGSLKAAIERHRATIARDTLALKLDLGSELPKDADGVTSDTLDGNELRLSVARAG